MLVEGDRLLLADFACISRILKAEYVASAPIRTLVR